MFIHGGDISKKFSKIIVEEYVQTLHQEVYRIEEKTPGRTKNKEDDTSTKIICSSRKCATVYFWATINRLVDTIISQLPSFRTIHSLLNYKVTKPELEFNIV